MPGKVRDFKQCNCPGLDDEIDRLYDQIENIDVDTKVDALQVGASPFDSLVVGQDRDAVGVDNINFYFKLAFDSLIIPASTANPGSALLVFDPALPAFLTNLKRGAHVSGYFDAGIQSTRHGAGSKTVGDFTYIFDIAHPAPAGDYNGTVQCRCFNRHDNTSTIPAGILHLMVISPARN